jgi:glycosyltransferase involved in cell wall biosynthesis
MDGMKVQYALFPSMQIVVIPNFFPKDFEGYIFNESSGDVPRLLFFSNLMKSKGVIELLEAVEILNRQGIEFTVDFAGHFLPDHLASAGELEKVFYQIKSENVHYLGPMFGVEKEKAFQQADIFILPTYYPTEAFPLTIVEALSMGCYVITTKHNYLPELISSDNGALVEPGSVEDLAKAIKAAINDKVRLSKVRRYNYVYSREHYSQDKYVDRIDDVF